MQLLPFALLIREQRDPELELANKSAMGCMQQICYAVSQTGGPETVLCGEAELPYALLGYATDYANGVQDEATPVQTLLDMMAASTETFAAVLGAAVPRAQGP